MNVSDAFKDWCEWIDVDKSPRTANDYKGIVSHYIKSVGIEELDNLTPKAISNWINANGRAGYNRRKLVLSVVKQFHGYARDMNFSAINPAAAVKVKTDNLSHKQKETKRVLCFTEEEYDKLILYLDNQLMSLMAMGKSKTRSKRFLRGKVERNRFWKCAIMLSYETGLRLSDVCQLEWDCIGAEELVVHTDKRDKRVAIPLWEKVLEAVTAIPPTEDKQYCFPTQRATLVDPSKRSGLSKGFEFLLKQCGIFRSGLGFHSLRHTCLTKWKSNGMDIEHIQKLAGHSSSETTINYIHE